MEQKRRRRPTRDLYKTGEDIAMLKENEYDHKKENKTPICDTHEDGA